MAAEARRAAIGLSVRVRTTVGATVVVGVALVVAGVLVVLLLRRDLTASVDAAADAPGRGPGRRPGGGERPGVARRSDDDDEALVQIVDEDGRVLAASEDLEGGRRRWPPTRSRAGRRRRARRERRLPAGRRHGRHRRRQGPGGRGPSAEAVEEGTGTVAGSLLVGVPVLLLARRRRPRGSSPVGPCGRSRPSGARSAAITDAELDRRVPAPGGRDEIARLAGTMNAMLDRLEAGRTAPGGSSPTPATSSAARSPPSATSWRWPRPTRRWSTSRPWPAGCWPRTCACRRWSRISCSWPGPTRGPAARAPARRHRRPGAGRGGRGSGAWAGCTVDASAVSAGQVRGDAGQLGRVVRNLADNAARHATATVRLGVARRRTTVRCWVADDGPGIPVADRERVFERFTRLDQARTRGTGGTAWGWPSPPRWCGPTAAASGWPTGPTAGPRSSSSSRLQVRFRGDPGWWSP